MTIKNQFIKKKNLESHIKKGNTSRCPYSKKCGGCSYLHLSYEDSLKEKKLWVEKLIGTYCKVEDIVGMENPYHYRNKIHSVFGTKRGEIISGTYEAKSHQLVPIDSCLIQDETSDRIIKTIRTLVKSFKLKTYREETGYGFFRYVMIRRAVRTGQVLVVLITSSPAFPSRNHFVKALVKEHPEITSIVQNINYRTDSLILGDRENIIYGSGFIEDILGGMTFRISAKSFYQVNSYQTEKLYNIALELSALTGSETVLDAYCGIGTIGLLASKHAKEVIGVEVNRDAVRDAVYNARKNKADNIQFYCRDAGEFLLSLKEQGKSVDVVLMDPPRNGSSEEFMDCVAKIMPERIIYISCGPQSLARDLAYFAKKDYYAQKAVPVDMFAWTKEVETVVLLQYRKKK